MKTHNTKAQVWLVVFLLVAVLSLVACGSSADDTNTTQPQRGLAAPAAEAANENSPVNQEETPALAANAPAIPETQNSVDANNAAPANQVQETTASIDVDPTASEAAQEQPAASSPDPSVSFPFPLAEHPNDIPKEVRVVILSNSTLRNYLDPTDAFADAFLSWEEMLAAGMTVEVIEPGRYRLVFTDTDEASFEMTAVQTPQGVTVGDYKLLAAGNPSAAPQEDGVPQWVKDAFLASSMVKMNIQSHPKIANATTWEELTAKGMTVERISEGHYRVNLPPAEYGVEKIVIPFDVFSRNGGTVRQLAAVVTY